MTKLTSIEINSYKHITIQQIGLHLYTYKTNSFPRVKEWSCYRRKLIYNAQDLHYTNQESNKAI